MRILLALFFTGGVLAAAAWWYLTPKGFSATHVRFWMNSVVPPMAVAVGVLGIVVAVRRYDYALKCMVIAVGAMVFTAGVSGKCLFPQSISGIRMAFAAVCMTLLLMPIGLAFWMLRSKRVSARWTAASIFAGAMIGGFLPWSQRALDSATKPYSGRPLRPTMVLSSNEQKSISLNGQVAVSPSSGDIRIESNEFTIEVHPLLTFFSRSPDRFWTIFAPRASRIGPRRSFLGFSDQRANAITLDYKDDGYSRLQIQTEEKAEETVRIEAMSNLPREVYSHLNSFCQFSLSGSGRIALSFSPCPEVVEMKPSQYPIGRPVRLAYLDADHVFHVVEARSGEKGPFRQLAKGRLNEKEPLRISVYHDHQVVCRISLIDWARQASKQVSLTAGWGLPENAIEFSLRQDGRRSVGFIYVTLAGTSVGRGWDSVGHTAGTYRNMMVIDSLMGNE